MQKAAEPEWIVQKVKGDTKRRRVSKKLPFRNITASEQQTLTLGTIESRVNTS
jgi:hypothetical protein